jgi:hypothetical protein
MARRGGFGKRKGGSFERKICKALSLWVSGGKMTDIFWRSAMSGGRATFHARKGVDIRQAGDICAVSQEGHALTDVWFMECKHIKNAKLSLFLTTGQGPLAKFWRVALSQAERHKRKPMLIVRSRGPIMVFVKQGAIEQYVPQPLLTSFVQGCDVFFFDDMLKYKFPIARRVGNGKV